MSLRDLFHPAPETWEPESAAWSILDTAIREHDPSHVFALFSGGHDSLCSTHVAMQHHRCSGVVSLFTGIGIKATRRFVYETCKGHNWPLRVYRPLKGNRYHEMVEKFGFPGRAQHGVAYIRLKERSIDRLVREHKRGRRDRVMLITGVRAAESRTRMGRVQPIQRVGATVWVAPIIEWTHHDKNVYMERHRLDRNGVVDLLHRSGECNCGAFGSQDELTEMRYWFPDDAAEIDLLQDRIRTRFGWGWGESPKRPTYPDQRQTSLMLCQSCEFRGAA